MPQALLCAGLDTNTLGSGSLHCHTALPKHLSPKTKPMEKMSLQTTANPEDTENFLHSVKNLLNLCFHCY